MYRQIMIHPDDRHYQMILWRKNVQEEPKVYDSNTVTYGTACAPFHALRCLHQLAEIHKNEYPLATDAISNNFYMDDSLSGA
uniref:Uncharacterized protein n=1 Tax=Bracon brevicornis TaxID=1563983 RepID=A0A6V7JSJ1_9HYME